MKVISVNTAVEKVINAGKKLHATGIFKEPRAGAVSITENGVEGDCIADVNVHGGVDQAVYLYSQADYDWWSETLGRELKPGTFGENLTITAFPEHLKIGDRLTVNGSVLLEITAPRVPCLKLAAKMDDPTFVKQFVKAERCGAYARVLTPGEVTAGDSLEWQQTTEDYALIKDVFIQWHQKEPVKAVFEKALRSPVSNIARRLIEQRWV